MITWMPGRRRTRHSRSSSGDHSGSSYLAVSQTLSSHSS